MITKLTEAHERELRAAMTRARRESEKEVELERSKSQLSEQLEGLQSQLSSLKAECETYKQAYARESRRRRAAHEKLMDIQVHA